MAEDYTDGGGWAKLDATAVEHIADIFAELKIASNRDHVRLILTMYRLMNRDGVIPCGYRVIAEHAGVDRGVARRLIAKLVERGHLARLDRNNGYCFSWIVNQLMENDIESSDEKQVTRKPGKNVSPADTKSRQNRVTGDTKSRQNRVTYRSPEKDRMSFSARKTDRTQPRPGGGLVPLPSVDMDAYPKGCLRPQDQTTE